MFFKLGADLCLLNTNNFIKNTIILYFGVIELSLQDPQWPFY
jgi:hypothetical protein